MPPLGSCTRNLAGTNKCNNLHLASTGSAGSSCVMGHFRCSEKRCSTLPRWRFAGGVTQIGLSRRAHSGHISHIRSICFNV